MHGRPGFLARFVLVIVFVQAAVGLLSRSAILYFFQPVVVDTLIAFLFAGSLAIRRPIIGEFARETYPFPPEVRESQTYRSVFGRITLVWSAYFFLRALVRLAGLASGRVEVILIVLAVSDAPFIVALTLWSIWQGIRGFRASEEWGPALAALEAEPAA